MFKLKYHGKLTAIRVAVEFCILGVRSPGLAHRQKLSLLEGFLAQLTQEIVQSRTIVRDLFIRLLRDLINHIQSEPTDPFLHPPENHIIDLPAYLGIFPVEIWLFYGKLMKIVLP